MEDKELWLVRLPKIKSENQDYFGIGYYENDKFIFSLITEDMIKLQPLRNLTISKCKENTLEFLGKIKPIKKNFNER